MSRREAGNVAKPPRATGLASIAGYLLRRAQQVHNALWSQMVVGDLTSPQYAVLAALASFPDIPQQQVAQLASLDKSSAADVVNRLVARSWISRERDPDDGRRYVLTLTSAAAIALSAITPSVEEVQAALLRPLEAGRRRLLIQRLAAVARVPARELRAEAASDICTLDLGAPGHLIRRAQQVHTSLWGELVGSLLTGPQFAVLYVVSRRPGINQTQLGELAALDKSSTADVVSRLMRRELLVRERDSSDGRGRMLYVPESTVAQLKQLAPAVRQVQNRLLEPLGEKVRSAFLADLAQVAFVGEPPSEAL
ncbi:MarR family winged helix-turn-helix transcriptional regulator [Mycolicibacterium smegmatis]|uniref:MarR family winged helix-turn-helix transcriptional regulator n=1 Tax=Mycolicibacterium smegmatis TaxID=1772 RepID=UPI0020A376B2|nr:MarR family winged helix-turn-helix transcriptional regulator [Mycolicibacterium smegmatis]MCP2627400.1 MarR family winged helix-turn-helix transcriptional regulator [Mycolicibacterium smegmatis]